MSLRSLSIVLLSLSATTLIRAEESAAEPPGVPVVAPPPNDPRMKSATDRARAVRSEDRTRLGKPLEELAALWTRVQKEFVRASELERTADQKEKELGELEERTKRARLLIEQTEARHARARSRLKELEGTQGR